MAAAPKGNTSIHGGHLAAARSFASAMRATPVVIAAMPKADPMRRLSRITISAKAAAKTGVRPPTQAAILGPINRFDSKLRRATVAGNSTPTHANKIAAAASKRVTSMVKGAIHQKSTVEAGTL